MSKVSNDKTIEVELKPDVRVIAIAGPARAGKNTAAMGIYQHVLEHASIVDFQDGYVVGMESFAGPIKSMAAMLLDFFGLGDVTNAPTLAPYIDGDLREDVIPELGVSTRKLLQTLGTEWGRNTIDENIWVNCMRKRIEGYKAARDHGYKGAVVVIPDLRFDNEAESLKSIGATIIKIEGEPAISGAGHVSEAGISEKYIDFVIANDSTVEELQEKVRAALRDVLPTIPADYIIPEEDEDDESRS